MEEPGRDGSPPWLMAYSLRPWPLQLATSLPHFPPAIPLASPLPRMPEAIVPALTIAVGADGRGCSGGGALPICPLAYSSTLTLLICHLLLLHLIVHLLLHVIIHLIIQLLHEVSKTHLSPLRSPSCGTCSLCLRRSHYASSPRDPVQAARGPDPEQLSSLVVELEQEVATARGTTYCRE